MSPLFEPSVYILQGKKTAQVKNRFHRLLKQVQHNASQPMTIDGDGVIVNGNKRRVVAHIYAQDHHAQYQDFTETYLGIDNPAQLFAVGGWYYMVVDVLQRQSPHAARATIERAAAQYNIGVQHLTQQATLDFQQQLQQENQGSVAPAIIAQWPVSLSLDWLTPWHAAGGVLSIVARSLTQPEIGCFVTELDQLERHLVEVKRKGGCIDFAQQKKFERGIGLYTQWQQQECRITQTSILFHHVGDHHQVAQQQAALANIAQSSDISTEPLSATSSHDALYPVSLTQPQHQPLLNSRIIDYVLMQPVAAMPF